MNLLHTSIISISNLFSHPSRVILPCALMIMALSSCVHEWPDPVPPVDEPDVPEPVECSLRLVFDSDEFEHLTTVELSQDESSKASRSDASSIHLMRHIVRLYPYDSSKGDTYPSRNATDYHETTTLHDPSYPDYSVPLKLKPGEYDIVVWSEHAPSAFTSDYYYDTSDFFEISVLNHSGNNHYRTAWRGLSHIFVNEDGEVTATAPGDEPLEELIVNMTRPMARYRFVTTDLERFLSTSRSTTLEDYDVVIRYTGYMPSSYNLFTDKPVDSTKGITYHGESTIIDSSTASLGYDYVMVNGSNTSVQVALDLYRRSDGTKLSSSGVIDVPLKRGHYTVIRGPLLTTMAGASMGISPDFFDEFNIEIF